MLLPKYFAHPVAILSPYTVLHTAATPLQSHLIDNLPLKEICDALHQFPDVGCDFFEKSASLLPAYRSIVTKKFERFDLGEQGLTISGSQTRSPDNFWMKKLYPNEEDEQVEQSGEPVVAKLLPIQGIASSDSDFLRSVVFACDKLKKYSVCESDVVSSLIRFKWDKYVEKKFKRNLCLYVLLVLSFSVDALFSQDVVNTLAHKQTASYKGDASDTSDVSTVKLVALLVLPMTVTFLLWCYFVRHELKQIIAERGFRERGGVGEKTKKKLNWLTVVWRYFTDDLWNVLDGMTLSGIFTTYALRVGDLCFPSSRVLHDWSTIIHGLVLPLVYLNTLFYIQGFEQSGELVRMIVGIIKGIGYFMLILVDVVVGFALSFYVLYRSGTYDELGYSTPFMSIFSGYTLMLGDFDISEFTGSVSFLSIGFLFTVFTLLINIVLLNLLIALMGDIFDRIQENAQAEFLYGRACIILEFESLLSESYKKENLDMFPKWLQVLVPAGSDEKEKGGDLGTESWGGKMKAIRRGQESVKEDVESVKKEMKEGQESVKTEVESLKAELASIKALLVESLAQKAKGEEGK